MKEVKDNILGNIYRFDRPGEEKEAVADIEIIVAPYNLSVEMLHEGIMSRGVQGDEGTYTRVIVLSGVMPDSEILQELSTKITNRVSVNRILFNIMPIQNNNKNN